MSARIRNNVTAQASKFKTEHEFREFSNALDFGVIISGFETSSEKKKVWYDANVDGTLAHCIITVVYGGPCGELTFPGESRQVRENFEIAFDDNFWKYTSIGTSAVLAALTAYSYYCLI